MSNRINGFIVTLESNVTDETSEIIRNAIGMIKSVAEVSPIVEDFQSVVAKEQAKFNLRLKLVKAFEEA